MAQFRVSFDCDNEAFDGDRAAAAIAAVLQSVAKQVATSGDELVHGQNIRDHNGNSIGRWDYSERNDLNT